MEIKPAMIGISCGYGDMFFMGYTMLYNRFDAMLVLIKNVVNIVLSIMAQKKRDFVNHLMGM